MEEGQKNFENASKVLKREVKKFEVGLQYKNIVGFYVANCHRLNVLESSRRNLWHT